MKKILNIFLVMTILCMNFIGFIDVVNAVEPDIVLNESTVIERIDYSEDVAKDIIDKLTNWSNSHATVLKDLFDRDFMNKLDSSDFSIQLVIDELELRGSRGCYECSAAAYDLKTIKPSIMEDIEYLKQTIGLVSYYLDNYESADELKILMEARTVLKNLKPSISKLVKIYYDLYYDEVNDKIDSFENYSELVELYEELSEKLVDSNALYNKVMKKLNSLKDLYISKNLDIYDPIIEEELRSYFEPYRADYEKLYNKLEAKLQTKLDEKINSIVDGVDTTNVKAVIDANNQLKEIMNKIFKAQNEVNSKFNQFSGLFDGVDFASKYATKYKKQIVSRLQKAYNHTESYLIKLNVLVTVRNESDKKILSVNNEKGLIVYDSKNLAPSILINKLQANYGNLRALNTYSSNIGTKSIIQAYYENDALRDFILVVRGDINPNGEIDITDLVALCDKIYGLKDLDEYQMIAADFDNNSKIDITDLVNLCDRIYE